MTRYPGRACLLGEHCDWAGGASLAVPLPLGVAVEGRPAPPGSGVTLTSHIGGSEVHGRWEPSGSVDPEGGELRFVGAALHVLSREGLDLPDTALVVESDLPPGRGFSSSAAFTLAVLDAMARRAGRVLGLQTLSGLAFEVEHDLLGVECGLLDQIACAEAAPVFIRWHDDRHQVRAVTPGSSFHLIAIALPAPRDTKTILAALNEHHGKMEADAAPATQAKTKAVRTALGVFAREAERGVAAVERGDARELGDAMNRAQDSYETDLEEALPEMAAPLLRKTCAGLREEGALGAKFSGAGGDGSVVALFPTRAGAEAAVERIVAEDAGTAVYCPIH